MPAHRAIRRRAERREDSRIGWHVYLVFGQSNVVGTLTLDGEMVTSDSRDKEILFYQSSGSVDAVTYQSEEWGNFKDTYSGFGPEKGLARTLLFDGVENVAVVKFARNGMGLGNYFKPSLELGFRAAVQTVRTALGKLEEKIGPATIDGLLWFQGHGDTSNESYANEYAQNLTNFLTQLRAELGCGIPAVIGRGPVWWVNEYKDVVRSAQVSVAENELGWVDSDDTTQRGDDTHLTSGGKDLVGYRAAQLFLNAL